MIYNNDDDFMGRETFIQSCMDSRIDNLGDDFTSSAAYMEFSDKYQDILKKLANLLPSETFELVLQLDCLNGKLSVDNQVFFYKQGFFDCRRLFNFLRR